MAKKKVFGILESETVLLEPVAETRYTLDKPADSENVGRWVTVSGSINDSAVSDARVVNVEKAKGKTTRSGTVVADAPNLPAEADGAGGYLYQEKKGRYYLLSQGAVDQPVEGDFSRYTGKAVKVSGEFGSSPYILYNVRVSSR